MKIPHSMVAFPFEGLVVLQHPYLMLANQRIGCIVNRDLRIVFQIVLHLLCDDSVPLLSCS